MRNKKLAVYLSFILIITAAFPVYAFGGTRFAEEGVCDHEVSLTSEANHVYAEEIHLGECRYLSVSGDTNGKAYTWKVSDDRILSVNPEGRCKGLSSDSINGYSETCVFAEKDGVTHEMWIKVLPAACVDLSTIGVPGAKWDVSGIFKEAAGKVRYRSTRKSVIKVDKNGIAKGKKAGSAEVIKEVKNGSAWTEVDRESFTVCQPSIRSELTISRLKYPALSANMIIINSDVLPSGFMSSKTGVISVENDMLKFNKQGKATIYTLYGTVGKPLKRYRTRIEVIGKL